MTEDYDTAGDAFFGDATDAARAGAARAAHAYLRWARACWWTAEQMRREA